MFAVGRFAIANNRHFDRHPVATLQLTFHPTRKQQNQLSILNKSKTQSHFPTQNVHFVIMNEWMCYMWQRICTVHDKMLANRVSTWVHTYSGFRNVLDTVPLWIGLLLNRLGWHSNRKLMSGAIKVARLTQVKDEVVRCIDLKFIHPNLVPPSGEVQSSALPCGLFMGRFFGHINLLRCRCVMPGEIWIFEQRHNVNCDVHVLARPLGTIDERTQNTSYTQLCSAGSVLCAGSCVRVWWTL